MTAFAYVLWFVVVILTSLIVYGFMVAWIFKVKRHRAVRDVPFPPQRTHVRIVRQGDR